MTATRQLLLRVLPILFPALLLPGAVHAAGPARPAVTGLVQPAVPVHALGWVEAGSGITPAARGHGEAAPGDGVPWVVVETRCRDLFPRGGTPDPAPLVERVRAQRSRGARVAVLVHGSPAVPGTGLEARRRDWLRMLRAGARELKGEVAAWLLADFLPAPGTAGDARLAAYEIKAASVTIHGEDPAAAVDVVVHEGPEVDLLARAWKATGDLAPYVDGVTLVLPVGRDAGKAVSALREELRTLDPGAALLVLADARAETRGEAASDDVLARALDLLAAGADATLLRLPEQDAAAARATAGALEAIARVLGPGLGLSPRKGAGIEVQPGPVPVRWVRFFDDRSFREVLFYWAGRPGVPGDARAAFVFEKAMRRGYRAVDPLTGTERFLRAVPLDDAHVRVEAPLARRPRMLLVNRLRVSPGIDLAEEREEVAGVHRVTPDEIIAFHQRFRSFQDDRLRNVHREGWIKFRVRYAQVTGTFEIEMHADWFWDPETGGEWAIRETFFDGVKLKWKKIPEIPLVTKDRVVALPLDLNLDRRYRYRLEGEEEVEGRRCWRLRFQPLSPGASLYRGRAWIDQATGALVKVSSVQTELTPPAISDEQTQLFRPWEGPDGTTYWLLEELSGQQIYTVNGSNLVVLRQITFGPPEINDPGFADLRARTYASDRQMLRDTPEGFKWLSKTKDGRRVVNEKGDPTQLFLLGGALYDEGTEGVIPLAGVNYTNINLFGRKKILNVFFAGAFANVTYSDPSVLGRRLDLGVTLNAVGYPSTDKDYVRGEEIESHRLQRLRQALRVNLGVPLGSFVKLRAMGEMDRVVYQRHEDTRRFVVPADHWERIEELELAFDRKGWSLMTGASWHDRSDWLPWGPEGAVATREEVARTKDWTTWWAGVQKSWFLPLFQKIEVSARYQAGDDLDRFSSFTFGFLSGDRLRGFGGSGIRYDHGLLAQVKYSFNISDVVRFDAVLDHARVHDPRIAPGMTDHTGVGVAASFLGPWETILRFDVGYALRSDLDPVEGDVEAMFLVLKLF